ncbi:hypothetical protein SAMN02745181_1751 [Rubritalea squalenifaciens DSM 18772]|uniref:Uncharacterized protein n=1 Tax=Rubritalea squalenifaciens DSM 18772 TaxID=1123071 RepID=A0A1M6IBV6_9BACT|nr:hypothetical protein SAMN02745181_1751 [Rubritalea squalenifaciens DSM 18772]
MRNHIASASQTEAVCPLNYLTSNYTMPRKLTALVMLWLMLVGISTSQPGLGYCLCIQNFFVGKCECLDVIPEGACSRFSSEESCDCSSQDTSEIDVSPNRGQDCSLDLYMELDNFVAVDSIQSHSRNGADPMASPRSLGEIATAFSLTRSIHGIRGSPPFVGLIPSVSLRVRYSVFLV